MRSIRAVAAVFLLVAFAARSARANDWYVDSQAPPGGDGSAAHPFQKIGKGVQSAAGGDRVLVAAGQYAEHLTIGKSISILGDRNAATTVDGGGHGRLVTIPSGNTVWLQDLILARGRLDDSDTLKFGAGIGNEGTLIGVRLHVDDCHCYSTTTDVGGGAIENVGEALLWSCWIERCSASTGYNFFTFTTGGAASGGAIHNLGRLKLFSTTLSSNAALTDVNFVTKDAKGGAIYNEGTVRLVNATIHDNDVFALHAHGGGIFGGSLYVDHSTISSNSASTSNPYGSGLDSASGGGIEGAADVLGSVIAGNSVHDDDLGASSYGPDFYGRCNSLGYLLIGDTDDTTIVGDLTGVQTGVDPKLLALGDNGGPVPTQALDVGSPCIDSGSPDPFASPPYDARDYPRALWDPATGASDLGAYESGSAISYLLNATPDIPLPAGATVMLATGGGIHPNPNLTAVVAVNGAPLFLPLFLDTFDQASVIRRDVVVPAGFSGTTVALRSFSFDAAGKLEHSNEADLVFQ